MRNTPRARFLVRLRKVTWLLPLAVIAGAALLERVVLPGILAKRDPLAAAIVNAAIHFFLPIAWVPLAMLCSGRAAVRFVRAKKLPESHRADATLIVGFVAFFCYVLVGAIIMKSMRN